MRQRNEAHLLVSFQSCDINSKNHLKNVNYYFQGLSTVPVPDNKNVTFWLSSVSHLFLFVHFHGFANNYDVEYIGSLILRALICNKKGLQRTKFLLFAIGFKHKVTFELGRPIFDFSFTNRT